MWVTLELAYSIKACFIAKGLFVLNVPGLSEDTDTFMFWVKNITNQILIVGRELGNRRFYDLLNGLELMPWQYARNKDSPCFGQVFSLIARKECRDFRDRHLVIASFLGLATHDRLYS
jgi:hypothetical protein